MISLCLDSRVPVDFAGLDGPATSRIRASAALGLPMIEKLPNNS
jgi:hypothetical protein